MVTRKGVTEEKEKVLKYILYLNYRLLYNKGLKINSKYSKNDINHMISSLWM